MRLYKAVLREIPENLKPLLLMNILSAVATMSLVALVSTAAREGGTGQISGRLMLMFAITVTLYHVTHIYTLVTASKDTERLIHKLRIGLFDLIRRTDLVTIEKIGHATLQGVLTQDTQILAEVLPMVVIGFQQAVMLLFLAAYLAWLSPVACILAFGLAGLTVAIRFSRVRALRTMMQRADEAEKRVFDGLTELLHGFKEIRMNALRADDVTRTLAAASRESCRESSLLKAQWGRNYAVIEAMLFSLVGLMVFVVPLWVAGFHAVILPTTIAVLFISGPVSTVSFVTPLVTKAEMALENIEKIKAQLFSAAKTAASEESELLEQAPLSIALSRAELSFRDGKGAPLFKVGPLNAEFRAGEITMITGGNGSGKSTLLRLLTGLIPLDSGFLLADHAELRIGQMQDYRNQFSAIFSDFHLSRRLASIEEPDQEKIRLMLERFGMQEKVSVVNGSFSTIDLSSGQRKRLALIVAELEDKPIIVLDEWAADQDPHFRRIFYEELLPDMKTRGKIIIAVTHDDRWFHLADRMYRMNEGQIEETNRATVI
ncbi:cyclic peptide export ABC transporter [Chlorobium ferrooxidans]|uniref:Cyclic peptide transporter n=1 Tax=Chlorobium ferrooxidans DSM 13031 TaxID=377431 RepID=Q0YRE3_9CHLB|nr:cyclic peptide export ABC transporter [Chlorobium ferrooxidans]EAT58853.1 Cyclic peptide transporter [Chlorobium ferrooxidans DSM 13031]